MKKINPEKMLKQVRFLYEFSLIKNLSPKRLAPYLGVHFTTIYRWFNGFKPLPAHERLILEGIEKIKKAIPGDTPEGFVSWGRCWPHKNSFRVMSSHKSPHWLTPPKLYKQLNQEFHFNDDPCPDNGIFGLDREWGTSAFVNPPYGPEIKEWLEKGLQESKAGKTSVFLLPARTDTKWFHELVLPYAECRFIKGRLKFENQKYSAPFPSMLVIFRPKSIVKILQKEME